MSAWVHPVSQQALAVRGACAPGLPWLGVRLLGLADGEWRLGHRGSGCAGAGPALARPPAALGSWALTLYMVHQPVLSGASLAWRALTA